MEYVYVEDGVAERLKFLNDVSKILEKDVCKVIDEMREQNDVFVESLNENSIRFKLFAKDIAKGYKEAVDVEVESLYSIWEELEDKRSQVYKKTKEIKENVESTKSEIQSLQKAISELNVYGMDRLISLIEKFNGMSASEKDLLAKLAEISNK